MKRTLKEIIEKEESVRHEDGDFGIKACKESIKQQIKWNKELNQKHNTNQFNTSLYVFLETYVERANNETLFNDAMVLACWELINGIK